MSNATPFISQRSVQQTLDTMLRGSQQKQPNPLENLILVEEILYDSSMPSIESAANFALHRLLIDLIRHKFASQCRIFDLEVPQEYETRAQALQTISQKPYLQSPELAGWVLLYYRYVRADLNIKSSDLLEIIPVDTRTLRRYQANAVKRLTQTIALRERSARREKQRRYLYSQLPISINERIWGRDKVLEHAHSIIGNRTTTPHLLITGPTGIGKTSFVQTVVQNLIDDDSIDQLVWITQPQSIQFVYRHLKQVLLQDTQISLKEYSLLNRLIVVLDDINRVTDAHEAEVLFQELNNAILLVTNNIYRHFGSHFSHILLSDLDKDAVVSIVKSMRHSLQNNPKELSAFVMKLHEHVGGNPMAIKLAANNFANINLHQPLFVGNEDVIFRLFLSSYEATSLNAQTILLMLALFPPKPITLTALATLWAESKMYDSDIITLLSCGLIVNNPGDDGYILPDTSRRFVHQLYDESTAVQSRLLSLVEKLNDLPSDLLPDDVAEHILLQDWLEITQHHKQRLAQLGIGSGLRHGNYAVWATILENIISVSQKMDLKLAYAICLRQLLDFPQAEALFLVIIENYGRNGDFQQQGRGMVELGILYRQQGLYEQAIELLERARSILERQNEPRLLYETDIEIAQAVVDVGEIDSIKAIIPDLSTSSVNNAKGLILLSEILLRMKDYGGAKLYAERAAKHAHGASLGRVYAVLGRIAAEQKDFESAQDWFDLAISLLEQGNDWYGLARAKSNLGAAFIAQRQYVDDAEELLIQAQATQRMLNDRAGTIYTAHNIEVLNTMKWIDET